MPYSAELDARIPTGAVIPGVIVAGEFSGDRADVRCAARWASGHWALEVARRLDTHSQYDVPIRRRRLHAGRGLRPQPDQAYPARPANPSRGGMMRKICKVTLNNETFLANCGDLLLDRALMNGVDLPHDCRAGICGACRVRLVEGKVFGGHEPGDDMIHACQARIVSDLEIVTETVPDQVALSARVANIVRLAPDVFGVDVELPKPLHYLPGQYCKVQFRGFPARSYSPTYPLEGRPDDRLLHFHIRRFPTGLYPRRWAGTSASGTASN